MSPAGEIIFLAILSLAAGAGYTAGGIEADQDREFYIFIEGTWETSFRLAPPPVGGVVSPLHCRVVFTRRANLILNPISHIPLSSRAQPPCFL